VLLIFGLGALNQSFGIKPFRLRQHRGGHLDDVITGEQTQDLWRGGWHRAKADCQQRPRGFLNRGNKPDKNVVDQIDLVVGICVRPDEKEIGEVTQHGRPALVGAVRDRAVQLVDEFEGSAHRSWETVLVGHGSGICGWLTSI